jgi:xanthine dehydrogenase iron-sulfur cluster and FAD-binding subunit A
MCPQRRQIVTCPGVEVGWPTSRQAKGECESISVLVNRRSSSRGWFSSTWRRLDGTPAEVAEVDGKTVVVVEELVTTGGR